MVFEVRCDCGWEYRGEEEDLIGAVQRHAREVHEMEITPEQALAQARPVE